MDDINYDLMEAVRIGNLESVRKLINRYCLLHSKQCADGYLLLRNSIELKHIEITKLLLNSGSNVNAKSRKSAHTALHFAVENGDFEIVGMLLDRGANINAKNKSGSTPLLCAVMKGNEEIAELLLKRGSHIFGNKKGITPLEVAIEKGLSNITEKLFNFNDVEMAEFVLNKGANICGCYNGETPLHMAAASASSADAGRKKRFTPRHVCDITPLHIAAEKGLSNIAEQLLKLGADVNSASSNGFTPLHFAVAKRKRETTELLLNCGANVDAKGHCSITPFQVTRRIFRKKETHKNNEGITRLTPLHLAVANDKIDTIKLLINHGANVDAKASYFTNLFQIENNEGEYFPIAEDRSCRSPKTSEEFTPLHFAAIYNDVDIIKLLLNNNASIEPCEEDYMTPLYVALQCNSIEAAMLLFEHGANVDAKVQNGKTILNAVVTNGSPFIVEEILKHFSPDLNNDTNKDSLNIACKAFDTKNKKIIQCLLEYGFAMRSEDVNDDSLVYNVIRMGYSKLVGDLLKFGLDLRREISDSLSLPLHIAVINKRIEVTKLLLTHGADVNAKDKTGKPPIVCSTENSDLKMTKLLLSYGANINENNGLLKTAVKKACTKMVETLLQNQIDIEATDRLGRTALHYIALIEDDFNLDVNTRGEIARLLLSYGANVNAVTNGGKGFTTLELACQNNFKNIVEILLEYKADINYFIEATANDTQLYTSFEKTALHIVADNNNVDLLKMLIAGGANLECKDSCGYTPLHLAAEGGNLEVASELLKHGALIDAKNSDGYTALHISCERRQEEIVSLLLEFGADINIMTDENATHLDLAKSVFAYSYDEEEEEEYEFYTIKIIKLHLVKLKTANFYINEQNLSSVDKVDDLLTSYRADCEKEVQILKQDQIVYKVSFYDILTKNTYSLAKYARNEDIVKAFESNIYKSKFPIYANMIERNFKKGFQRKILLEQCDDFVECNFKLPYGCVDQIMSYFSDADLKVIIDLWKQLSSS